MRYMKKEPETHAEAVIRSIVNEPASDTDPLGSYTGHPTDEGEIPVQDADDL